MNRILAAALISCAFAVRAWSQPGMPQSPAAPPDPAVHAEFVAINRLAAAVYRPAQAPTPHIGFIYMNGGSSALSHAMCPGLAKRGFVVLCATTRMEAAPKDGPWEQVALDMKAAMDYLRAQPGITRVILIGHSGGGANASFYQAVAENGPAFCQDRKKLTQCVGDFSTLKPADAIVFPDAHPGLGIMSLRQINPAVTFTADGIKTDPTLDPFNPANGFSPTGPAHYSQAFQQRYFAAQAATMNALILQALAIKASEEAGTLKDPRANLISVPSWSLVSHLDILDPTIPGIMITAQPRKLLHNDGSITTEIVHSVEHAEPGMVPAMASGYRAMYVDGVTHFLSQGAVRATDSLAAIDFCSSNSVTLCNVGFIHVPVLFAAMGASTFLGDDERMFERSAAKDKDYIVIEGALHAFTPCTRCETTPGQYSHSFDNTLDYIAAWANKRF